MMLAQAVTFFSAGQESMSSMLNFAFYELAANPAIQEKVRQEILGEIRKHGELTYEAIMEMKYLDMVCHGIVAEISLYTAIRTNRVTILLFTSFYKLQALQIS